MKPHIVAAAALLAALASPSPGPQAADTAPAPAAVHTKDFVYAPASLKVTAGTTVTFFNDDDVAHTITADDKSFDSKDMAKGAKWTHTFATAGTYKYICTYHTFMKGEIVVTGGS